MAAPLPAHARYGSRLAALRADEAILPPVGRAAERLSLAAGSLRADGDAGARRHLKRALDELEREAA